MQTSVSFLNSHHASRYLYKFSAWTNSGLALLCYNVSMSRLFSAPSLVSTSWHYLSLARHVPNDLDDTCLACGSLIAYRCHAFDGCQLMCTYHVFDTCSAFSVFWIEQLTKQQAFQTYTAPSRQVYRDQNTQSSALGKVIFLKKICAESVKMRLWLDIKFVSDFAKMVVN